MAHPVDRHIGSVIRARRHALGMSQGELARRLCGEVRQIQSYERGEARADAAMLFAAAKVLSMPVTGFFAGLDVACARRA